MDDYEILSYIAYAVTGITLCFFALVAFLKYKQDKQKEKKEG